MATLVMAINDSDASHPATLRMGSFRLVSESAVVSHDRMKEAANRGGLESNSNVGRPLLTLSAFLSVLYLASITAVIVIALPATATSICAD